MKSIFLLSTCILVAIGSFAQFKCGWQEADAYMRQHHPDYAVAMQEYVRQFEQIRHAGLLQQPQNASRAVRTIPVVVHVVLPSNLQNAVSDAGIQQMINYMNQDFRLLNPNFNSQTRTYFKQFAKDAEIEFCLAKRDPSGNATTGITRTNTTVSCFNSSTAPNDMKSASTGGKAAWQPTKYLNIWIVDLCGSSTSGTAGYAYLPTNGVVGQSIDGIVLDYQLGFGTNNRSASHEAGHYLGLNHTWGALSGNACGNVYPDTDDGFSDTPDSRGPNYTCSSTASCANNSPSGDMHENIMDYSTCPTMFTTQQANFMNLILNGGPFTSPFNTSGFASRASLVNNNLGCVPTGAPLADFTADKTNICVGEQVTFTNNTTGNTPITYSWTFQGGNPATSTAVNPVVTYPVAGTYSVTLTATNSNGTNQAVKTGYITVLGVNNLPLVEGFEATTFPPSGWRVDNPDGGITWTRATNASGYSQSTASVFYNCYNYSTTNQRDWLITPNYNFSNVTTARLKFDYAYARFSTNSRDSLQILYSTDCGTTWTQLWKRGGASLQTTSSTITSNFVPSANQWRTDSITLTSGIAGQSSVRFAFVGINNYGNNIYLDNINIYNVSPTTPSPPVADFIGTPTTVVVGNSVTFTDLSTNSPTSWSWSFPGGTPSSSTAQNPVITYNTVGQYAVTLVSANAGGNSAPVTKNAYIHVVNPPASGTGCDTLDNVPNDTSAALYAYPFGTGYLSGNNSDGDLAKAERFVNNKTVTVNGAFFRVFAKSASPGSKTVTFAVWNSSGPGGTPGASPLATSTYPLSQLINPNGVFIYVPFSGSPSVSGNFYVGVVLPTTPGDTVALLTTLANPAYRDSLYAWERYANGNWVSYATSYGSSGFGFSHHVFPVICSTFVIQPPVPNFTANKTSVCVGQSVTFTDQSSGNPTSWSWSFGNGATPQVSTLQNPTVTFNAPGTYSIKLTVANANGSRDTTRVNYITVNPLPTATVTVRPVRCFGESNGAAKVIPSGSSPFTYSWSGGGSADSITNKTAGSYTVTITDSKGCTTVANALIPQPSAPLTVSINVTHAICGLTNGSLEAIPNGGNGNNTFVWSNGKTGPFIDSLPAATYVVTVTDVNGCSVVAGKTVNDLPGNLTVEVITAASACGLSTGSAFASAITGGATTISSYQWNTGATTGSISGLSAGTYSVTVTNSIGCTASAVGIVADSGNLSVAIVSIVQPSNYGANDGSLTAAATGGVGNISYSWSNGVTGSVNSGLSAGVYSVTATDANGCKAVALDSLQNPPISGTKFDNNNFEWSIYPNPCKEFLWIRWEMANFNEGNMVITNMLGQSIALFSGRELQPLMLLDVSTMPPGIYTISFNSNTYKKTAVFVKQ
jgi:PKD repeat protein